MLAFLKDRILLFMIIIAGDWVSLSNFIKADEIKQDAITIAVVVSLIPSLIVSLIIKYLFQPRVNKKIFVIICIIISIVFWLGFLFSYLNFSRVNNLYGKISYSKNSSINNSKDSIIVGGCNYTKEAKAEVDDYAARNRTLTRAQLFDDFNYEIAAVWPDQERDCARSKILNAFAWMLTFLILGITLTCELLIIPKKPGKTGSPRQS